MPNPWNVIGWLLLIGIVLAVVVVALTFLAQQQEKAQAIVRTADVPPDARPADAPERSHVAPS